MRLQRLEIAGFKSFPDRSELTFEQGVTAIVGPERLRQEQRRRRAHVGARRAERPEPARRPDGGRDFRRQRRAQADGGRRGPAASSAASPRAFRAARNGRPASRAPATVQRRTAVRPCGARVTAARLGASSTTAAWRSAPEVIASSARRRRAAARARRRADAAALSIGRERVPDRRRDVPAARRAGPADGRRASASRPTR